MRNHLMLFVFFFVVGFSSHAQNPTSDREDPDFFPIAVWLQNPNNVSSYRNNGINMYVGIHAGLDQESLDLLKGADMKVICHQNKFALQNLDEPLIYAWMQDDEPDNAQWNEITKKYDPCIDPEVIFNIFEDVKNNDPSRPVYLNLGRGVAVSNWVGRGVCSGNTDMYKISNNGYLKACDIASYDVYPVNSNEKTVKDSLWYVAKGVDNLMEWSDYSKPIWCWIETTKIGEGSARKPTPAEVKLQVWMALVHGVSGIGYFCHSFHPNFDDAALLHDKEMIAAVKSINQQVSQLAPVLNSPTTSEFATVSSSNNSVPIDIMAKKHNGTSYIFAVAMRPGLTDATFEVEEGKYVEVIGENRSIPLHEGQFSDSFSEYAVHLYKIH